MRDEEVIKELERRRMTMSMCLDVESCMKSNNAINTAICIIKENSRKSEAIAKLEEESNKFQEEYELLSKDFIMVCEENEQLIKLMPKICETCKYEYELGYEEPCDSCKNSKNWNLKGVI